MNLTNAELLMIVGSPVFLITATATVRRYIPKLDGWRVVLFVFLLSEVITLSTRMVMFDRAWLQPTQWIYGGLAGLLYAGVALGANEKGNKLVERFAKALRPDDPPTPTDDPPSKAGPS